MKHIVIDARVINSSTGRYIERLLHYLEKIDTENKYTILVPKKDELYYRASNPNFRVCVANFKNYSLEEQTKYKKFLDKLSPDLVHFCMPQQPVSYRGKKITTIHDLTLLKTYNSDKNWVFYKFKQLVGYFVFKLVINSSDYLITDSDFTKNEIIAFNKKAFTKIKRIYLSADINNKNLSNFSMAYSDFILYVGQQSDYKNIKRLGDAHQLLLEKYPNLGLILVGKKNASAKINERYFREKKYKNILFTDFLPDSKKDWLYTKASAYVFPSLMEGFGLPGLEAMGYGAPVVSSNATCLPEIYGDAALYFDPLDVKDMANKISMVIDDHKLRNNLIKKGFLQLRKYSWERMARETLDIYKKVLKD